jgi:hypothetical protein
VLLRENGNLWKESLEIEGVSRSPKPDSRSPLLERADEENGHQRRDADAKDQERQLFALAFAL